MEIFRLFGSVFVDNSKANDALDKTDTKSKGLATTFGNVRAAMGAVGLLAAGYLKGAIESAAKAEQTNTRLKDLIENQGQSWDKAKGKVDDFTKGILKMSTYSGGEAKAALVELTSKGVKLNDAMGMQNTLVDLAAGKNIELSEAAGILSDAYNGKTRALVGLGLATKEEIKHGISFDEVQKRINERFNGAAAGQLNTYTGQMKQFTNNLNSLKTSIGQYILPYFIQISKHLNDLAQKINGMDPGTKKLIANVLGLTAVFGSLIGGAGLLQKIMGVLGPVVSGLGTVIGGLSLPIVAIIGVIVLLATAYAKNWGGMKDVTDSFINTTMKFLMDAFNEARTWFVTHWPEIKATFDIVMNAVQTAITTVFVPILKFILQQFGVVVDWVKLNWPLIQNTITIVINTVKAIIVTVLNAIAAFWQAHGQTIMTIVNVVFDIIKTTISTVLNVVFGIIKTVMQIINGDWSGAWNTLVNTVKTLFGGVGRIIRDVLSGIGAIFADIARTAIQWGENLIMGFINGITNKLNAIRDIAHKVTSEVAKFLGFNSPAKEGEGRHIVTWGQNMVKGFVDGMNKAMPNINMSLNKALTAPNLAFSGGGQAIPSYALGGRGSAQVANIFVELDGHTIVKAIGQPLVDIIRVKTGLKI